MDVAADADPWSVSPTSRTTSSMASRGSSSSDTAPVAGIDRAVQIGSVTPETDRTTFRVRVTAPPVALTATRLANTFVFPADGAEISVALDVPGWPLYW